MKLQAPLALVHRHQLVGRLHPPPCELCWETMCGSNVRGGGRVLGLRIHIRNHEDRKRFSFGHRSMLLGRHNRHLNQSALHQISVVPAALLLFAFAFLLAPSVPPRASVAIIDPHHVSGYAPRAFWCFSVFILQSMTSEK